MKSRFSRNVLKSQIFLYYLFDCKLPTAINNNTPTTYEKYNEFNHKNNPWMTAGLGKV